MKFDSILQLIIRFLGAFTQYMWKEIVRKFSMDCKDILPKNVKRKKISICKSGNTDLKVLKAVLQIKKTSFSSRGAFFGAFFSLCSCCTDGLRMELRTRYRTIHFKEF